MTDYFAIGGVGRKVLLVDEDTAAMQMLVGFYSKIIEK